MLNRHTSDTLLYSSFARILYYHLVVDRLRLFYTSPQYSDMTFLPYIVLQTVTTFSCEGQDPSILQRKMDVSQLLLKRRKERRRREYHTEITLYLHLTHSFPYIHKLS